jgi:hypothetical protein
MSTTKVTDAMRDVTEVDAAKITTGTLPAGRYTNTTYSVQDGELSENNFTDADHTKLNGIETSATADQTKTDIEGLGIDVPAANLTGTVATARLGTGTASSSTVLYGDQTYKTAPTTDLTAPGAIGGTTPAAGTFTTLKTTDADCGLILNSNFQLNFFRLRIWNNAGTLQHATVRNDVAEGVYVAPAYAPQFSGLSGSWGNTPLVDSTTDFINGVGIRSVNAAQIIFDTSVALTSGIFGLCNITYEKASWAGQSNPTAMSYSMNINGTTQERFSLWNYNNTGGPNNINTTNIATGKHVTFDVFVFLNVA